MKAYSMRVSAVVMLLVWGLVLPVGAQSESSKESKADLAQELNNPIADLMTIPIQMTYDRDYNAQDSGKKLQTNIQPVIPFKMNDDWNLITRTVLPLISQKNITPGSGSQFGLGDTSISLYASPSKPTDDGIIWGAGPILLLPTATDSLLGGEKWGAGPSGIVLTMRGPWTIGGLANHTWSYAGKSQRADVNASLLQPFAAYTWPNAWTVSVQSEMTYNWTTEKWSVPLNLAAAKLAFLGKLPVSLQAGVGYWLDSPETGPEGWRFRLQANIVLPK